jgi:hypothetical protein
MGLRLGGSSYDQAYFHARGAGIFKAVNGVWSGKKSVYGMTEGA